MDLWAVVVISILIIGFITTFGNKIVNFISSLFSNSFISIPLRHLSFITKNIDSILIISVFFILGIFYVVYYDVDLGKSTKNTELVVEKHKFSFKENLENELTKGRKETIRGMQVENPVDNALSKLMNIDIERDLQVTKYDNICDETDMNKLKAKCSLLKNKKTCDKPKCCTWCQSKNKCAAANNNAPIFQEDINCNV